jgi:hypothetical protein
MALVSSGFLNAGETEGYEVVLQKDVTHTVYVRPVDSGVDFDLFIYDQNGNLVAVDQTTATDALCQITPKWTGPFRLGLVSK